MTETVIATVAVNSNTYEEACKVAAMAGQPRPNFVPWGKVYVIEDRRFRFMSGFADTGRSEYEDDNGRQRRLPKGETFHTLTARLEELA